MQMEPREFLVPEGETVRADKFLQGRIPELSRLQIKRLFADRRVRVDGRWAAKGDKVKGGQRMEVALPRLTLLPNPDLAVCVHMEDEDFLVVEKPALISTHPLFPEERDTLVNALAAGYPEIVGVGSLLEGGAVHRLDRGTSGLLIVARNQRAYDDLRGQFNRREVKKAYLALVQGQLEEAGRISAPIAHHPKSARRMILARGERGRKAVTEYTPLRTLGELTLLKVLIQTGVRHQIRLHLASLGHPVAGDELYGSPASWGHPLLHASRLAFSRPGSGKKATVHSPLPQALARVVARGSGIKDE